MDEVSRGPFRVLGSRQIYSNPWFRVREDDVIHPGGMRRPFGVIEMKSGASVLAVNDAHEVYLVSEFKYAAGRETLEAMSGGIEPDEDALAAARRELREEGGLDAARWTGLGVIDPFTTVLHSPNYMFLAQGITEGEPSPDEGELVRVRKLPLAEAVAMVWAGSITHAATCVMLLKTAKLLLDPASAL